ncbi:MAG TPA: hypothetical protein VML91_09075 [Burkholderiales bacterium]|nr:hypothetical protein [Burkholderiales bacterium]
MFRARWFAAAALAAALACNAAAAQQQYLYVWTAGVDGQGDGSDKLVTVDVTRRSDRYGRIVHTLSVGGRGELASLGLTLDGRGLRAARASDGRIFEFDVGSDRSRPRLRRVTVGTAAGSAVADGAPREARDDRRVFAAGVRLRDDPDPVHFGRAYERDGEALTIAFEIDFRASRLGLPRAVMLLGP